MPSEFTREDYEHAARAAGYEIDEAWMEDRRIHAPEVLSLWLRKPYHTAWNPATSDTDALRLAVKLSMCVDLVQGADDVAVYIRDGIIHHAGIDFTDEDRYRATRHAIFRAAIEIGKSMKGTP